MGLFNEMFRWAGYGVAILSGTSVAAYAQQDQPSNPSTNPLYAGKINDGSIGNCASSHLLAYSYHSNFTDNNIGEANLNTETTSSSNLAEENLITRVGGKKDKCDAALKVLNALKNDDSLYTDMYETVLDDPNFRFVISEKDVDARYGHSYLSDSNEIILSSEALSLSIPEFEVLSIRQNMFHSFIKSYNELLKNSHSTEFSHSLAEKELNDIYHEITGALGKIKTMIDDCFQSGKTTRECKEFKNWLIGNANENSYHTAHTVVYYADTPDNAKGYQDIKNKRVNAPKKCKSQDIHADYNKHSCDVTVIREWDVPGKAYYIQYTHDEPLMFFHNQMSLQVADWKRAGERSFDEGFGGMVGSVITYLPPKAIKKYCPIFHKKLTGMVSEMKRFRSENEEESFHYHDDSYTRDGSEEASKMKAMLKFMKKSNDFRQPKGSVEEAVLCRVEIVSKFIKNKDRILFEHPGYYQSVMDFFEALTKDSWDNGKWKNTAIALRNTLKDLKKEYIKEHPPEPAQVYKPFKR